MEVLKQGQYVPMPVERQVVELYAATSKDESGKNWIREVPVDKVRDWLKGLGDFLEARHPHIYKGISEKKELTSEIKDQLTKALKEYRELFSAS